MYALLSQLLQPFTLLLLGLVGVLAWAWCYEKSRGKMLLVTSILLGSLVFLSTPLAGFLALRSLEGFYPPTEDIPRPNDTIVVLSGSLLPDDDEGNRWVVGPDTVYRCYYAAALYKKAGNCRLLLTGGKVDWTEPGPTLAEGMRDFMIELGVKPGDVVLEERSMTTYENALFSKAVLEHFGEGRVFLVTDAAHMLRARRCFESVGVHVIPAPCNYRARRLKFSILTFLPSVDGIDQVNDATHEWLGLAWYRLRH